MGKSLREQAFGGMQWTAASSTYLSVVQFVQIAVLAYFLSPEEIGTMSMLMLTIWFTQTFSDGGMSPAIIHYDTVSKGLLNTLYVINIGLALSFYAILIQLAIPISVFFAQPELPVYFPVTMLTVVIAAFGIQFRVVLTKNFRFDHVARFEMLTATFYFAITVILAALGYGVWSMVIGYLTGTITGLFYLIYYGQKFWRPSLEFSVNGLSKFLHFGKFQVGERALNFFNSRLDQIMIGSLLGPQSLGIYTIAYNLVIHPTIRISQVLSSVMFPVFARLQDNAGSMRSGYLKLIRVLTMINTPVVLGILLVAPLFIPLVFDAQWHESIYILQILSIYSLIRSTGSPAGSLQLAKGRADLGFKWNLFLLIITAPWIYAGVQLAGLPGMAWSLLLLQVLLFVPYWILMIKPLIGPPFRDYYMSIFQAILPGSLMALCVWAISVIPVFPYESIRLAAMILSGIILFFVLIRYLENTLYVEIRDLLKQYYLSR